MRVYGTVSHKIEMYGAMTASPRKFQVFFCVVTAVCRHLIYLAAYLKLRARNARPYKLTANG